MGGSRRYWVLALAIGLAAGGSSGTVAGNHRILCHQQAALQADVYVESPAGCLERGLGSTLEPSGALGATDPDVLQLNPGGVALIANRVLDYGTDKVGDESPAADQQNGATSDLARVRALFNSGADGGAVGSRINSVFFDQTISQQSVDLLTPNFHTTYYTGGSFGQREGVPGGAVNPPVTGGKNLLYPGFINAFVWLGYYSDKNGNGVVDDYEDPGGPSGAPGDGVGDAIGIINPGGDPWPATASGNTTCATQGNNDKRTVMAPSDDFFFIGGKRRNLFASDTPTPGSPPIGIHTWIWPGEIPLGRFRTAENEIGDPIVTGWGTDWGESEEEYYGPEADATYEDRTDVCTGFAGGVPVQQGFFAGNGAGINNDDNSVLERTWVITTVDAPADAALPWGRNLTQAKFLDIDEYDTIDEGLAATWNATVLTPVRSAWICLADCHPALIGDQTCQKSEFLAPDFPLGYAPTLDPGWEPGDLNDPYPSKCNADLALDSVDLADKITAQVRGPVVGTLAYPIYWHEPNQPGDVFPAIVTEDGNPATNWAAYGACREGFPVRQLDNSLVGCSYNLTAYAGGKTLWIDTRATKFIGSCNSGFIDCIIFDTHDLQPHGAEPAELADWRDKRAWNVDGRPIQLFGFVGFWHDLNGDGWVTADEDETPEEGWDCDLSLVSHESYYACGAIQQPHAYSGDTDLNPVGEDETSGGSLCGGPGAVLHVALHPFRGGDAISWPAGAMVQRNAGTVGDSISEAINGKPVIGNDPPGSPSNGAFFNPVIAHNAVDTDPATGDGNSQNDLDPDCDLNTNSWNTFGRVLRPAPGVVDYSIRITTTWTKDPDGVGPLPVQKLVDVDCLYGLLDTAPPPGCDFADG